MIFSLSILLLTVGATNSDFAFAHHKEGHDNGGGNDNGNNGNNGNENKKNKDKTDKRTDKEKYGEKSKNNLLKKVQKNIEKKNEIKEKKNENIDFIKPNKNKDKKTDSKITKFIQSKDQKTYAKKNGFDYHEGNTRLMINTNGLNDEILNKIKEFGIIEISNGNQIQISMPVKDISKISNISEIKNIVSTIPPIQNRDIIVDGRIIEDSIFAKNVISSAPVSIAIIDLAFNEKNQKILENVIESVSFRHLYENSDSLKIDNNESLHGTAMAQIITSMVPDVKLHLLSAGTELEFIDAMDYAISKEVDIITISYTWVNYNTDGSSAITKKVEDAIKSEITVVVPSGNYAKNHWEGSFNDTDGDKWHEFSNSDEGMTINVDGKRVYEEKPILIYLKWNDENSNYSDFDLTLLDSSGKIVDYSSTLQNQLSDKLEYIYYIPEFPGEYHIGISNFGQPNNSNLKIFSVYDELEYSQSQGSVGVPTDARGIIVAGSLGSDNNVQPFSSKGPTDNGQTVPNILVKDGISTEIYKEEAFYGTSASAAYVSGLIGVLYSEIDNINPMTITDLLYENMLATTNIENSEIQITGSAGKLSKPNGISDWYLSLNEDLVGQFPIKFTSNEKNNFKIISCEEDMILIQNMKTKDLMCVTESTAESMIKRNWAIQY